MAHECYFYSVGIPKIIGLVMDGLDEMYPENQEKEFTEIRKALVEVGPNRL